MYSLDFIKVTEADLDYEAYLESEYRALDWLGRLSSMIKVLTILTLIAIPIALTYTGAVGVITL